MGLSYNEETAKYKYNKAIPLDDLPIIGKVKKRKQHKKSDHKHEYIPAIIYDTQHTFGAVNYGFICKHCGRIDNLYFGWGHYLDKIKQFEEEHPDFIEVELPHD